MRSINLEDMYLFVQVVEQGNFTKAATYCGIPKSTLSRRISELENRMGIRLLRRTTRSITMTELGQEFYRRTLNILHEVDETQKILMQKQDQASGKVRIFAPVMFNYLFMDEITALCQRYPELILDLHVLEAHPKEVLERSFDILLHPGEPQDSTLIAKQVALFRSNFFASPDYLQRAGEPGTPAQLIGHDCIYLNPQGDHSPRWLFNTNDGHQSYEFNPKFIVDSPELASRMCSSGLGIARIPTMLANPLVQRGILIPLFDAQYESETPVYALYHERQLLPQRIRLIVSYMEETLQHKIDQLEQLNDCSN